MNKRIDTIIEMQKSSPEDPFLIYALAKEYEKLNQNEKALQQYLNLKDNHPDYTGFYYHLGKLYEHLENYEAALRTYLSGIKVCKKQSDFHALTELNNARMNLEIEM